MDEEKWTVQKVHGRFKMDCDRLTEGERTYVNVKSVRIEIELSSSCYRRSSEKGDGSFECGRSYKVNPKFNRTICISYFDQKFKLQAILLE